MIFGLWNYKIKGKHYASKIHIPKLEILVSYKKRVPVPLFCTLFSTIFIFWNYEIRRPTVIYNLHFSFKNMIQILTERLDHFMISIMNRTMILTLGRPQGQPHYYRTISYLFLFLFIQYSLYRLYNILNCIKNFPFKNKFPDMLYNSTMDLSWFEMNEKVIKSYSGHY